MRSVETLRTLATECSRPIATNIDVGASTAIALPAMLVVADAIQVLRQTSQFAMTPLMNLCILVNDATDAGVERGAAVCGMPVMHLPLQTRLGVHNVKALGICKLLCTG